MTDRIIRLCPYRNCGWQYEEPPVIPIRDLTVDENVRSHITAVEDVCRAHLNLAHPGWTLDAVEREALHAQIRVVFNADPLGPTTTPPRTR